MSTHTNQFLWLNGWSNLMMLVFRESIVDWDEHLLSSWKLVWTSSKSLKDIFDFILLNSDRNQLISNSDSGGFSIRLSISSSHTCLKSISTSAGQHFVDSEYVPWVSSHSEVEVIFWHFGDQIFIDGDSTSFKSFRWNLFLFIWDKMDAVREETPVSFLGTSVVKSELGVWARSVVSTLRIGLSFDISVTSEWSSTHAL